MRSQVDVNLSAQSDDASHSQVNGTDAQRPSKLAGIVSTAQRRSLVTETELCDAHPFRNLEEEFIHLTQPSQSFHTETEQQLSDYNHNLRINVKNEEMRRIRQFYLELQGIWIYQGKERHGTKMKDERWKMKELSFVNVILFLCV